jgi:eukaryotic-like serine/threonine-protein kinase
MPVLIFPMIVPNTPRKTLIASLLAASMDPLGILIAHWRGLEMPSLTVIGWNYFPNYVCALLAVIPSEIMMHLGRQVQQARELGSYRLGELIGRGGMGEVWRATHRMLARPAAIKLIRTDGSGRSQTQAGALVHRFRREAEAASLLESPHTIRLYDFGESRAGTFYCVMELLDGLNLETLVRRHGPVPAERAVYILRQVCHSLGEAHDRGLIHRDVKPANIYLCRLGRDYDFVKVLDFGLVQHEQDRSVLETMQSAPELSTAGTPAYIAPEALSGENVDRRVDLYALGCVAYWLLTGQLVFEADGPLQMLIQHLQATPVPPSKRTGHPVPAALEQLILRCLEKQPDDRPGSADEIAAELETMAAGLSWDQEQAQAFWQAHVARVGSAPSESEHRMPALQT